MNEISKHRKLFHNWLETYGASRVLPHARPLVAAGLSGATVLLRNRSSDLDTYRELFDDPGYDLAFEYLEALPQGATVLDLGANVGFFTIRALLARRDLNVIAFEALPETAEFCRANLALNAMSQRVTLHECAVDGETKEPQKFFINSGHSSASLRYGRGEHWLVEVLGINEAFATFEGDVGLLKVDIEGSEYEVIPALSKANLKRVQAIAVEIHGRRNLEASDLRAYIRDQGFTARSEEELCSLYVRD